MVFEMKHQKQLRRINNIKGLK